MTKRFRTISVFFVIGLLPTLAACGKSNPLVPTGPSPVPSSLPLALPVSGATIAGAVISNSSAAQSIRTFGSSTTIVVTIVGTNISAPVDAAGRFELTGVPAGDVTLQFSSPAGDARVTIATVSDKERIDLSVSLSGTTVVIVTIQRVTSDNAIELEGAVSNLTGACPALRFILNGTAVATDATTEFRDGPCTAVAPGMKVHAKGVRQANGSMLASRVKVEIEETELQGKISSVTGSCPTPTFVVNGTTVNTNSSTTFSGAGCSGVIVGAKVELKGLRQANGSVLATRVKVEIEETELEGKVSAFSGSCPNLTLTVNGTSVTTNSSTQFSGAGCRAVVVGAKVEIKGTRQPNGSILASRVKVQIEQAEIEGKVSVLSGSCPSLTLTVNATSVITNGTTQFSGGNCGKIKVGTKLEAKGIRQPNGSVLATRIELDAEDD